VLGGRSSFSPEELTRLAATVPPGSDGVVFHPYLLGERCPHWDGALRGSFVGLSLGHGPAHLARALLEGVAYSLKDASSVFQEGEGWPRPRMMTVVGGGTRSEVLVRILCDVFGQPFRVNPDADSAYGAALLALQSLGGHPESKDAATKERGTSLMSPNPEASRRYAEGFAAFRAIHERLQSYYHDAARTAGKGV
jgi:xylulokinase